MSSVEKSRLIVLHVTKYSDSSVIVHAVDSLCGRKSFFVRGMKGNRQAADFHPLNMLDVVSSHSPKSSLAYLREWRPVVSLESIRSDIYKSTVAMFLSEVIFRSLRTEESDSALFDWLCQAVIRLEAEEGSIANFHLWFLVAYCTKMGFRPTEIIEPQGIFRNSERELFQTILRSQFEQTLKIELSASRRQAFAKSMIQYLSYHLGADINIRSLDVLHGIFV